jgi:hypothetical protein
MNKPASRESQIKLRPILAEVLRFSGSRLLERRSAKQIILQVTAVLALSGLACNLPQDALDLVPTVTPELFTPTLSTTTTPTPPGIPTAIPTSPVEIVPDEVYPIAETEDGFLLGGMQNGSWLDAETTLPLIGITTYRVFRGSELVGEAAGAAFQPDPPGGPCSDPSVTFDTDMDLYEGLALSGNWDPVPRVPQTLRQNVPDYTANVESLLVGAGIPDPVIDLTAAFRVDLEGDEVDEVLITAVRLAGFSGNLISPPVAAGDYALIALRKVSGSGIEVIPLTLDVYPEANDLAYPSYPTIMAFLDLNGDGTLEIVIKQLDYEGRRVEVYEVKGNTAQLVLSAGCSL